MDIIIGTNADEGISWLIPQLLDPSLWEAYRNDFDTEGPRALFNIADKSDVTDEDTQKAHNIVEYYVGSVDNINENHTQGMFDMYTDSTFLYGTHKTIAQLVKHGVTVYHYIFTYEGEFSVTQVFGLYDIGVSHGDELGYLWDPVCGVECGGYVIGPLTGDDALLRKLMVMAWTNFAMYGNPTPPESVVLVPGGWTPVAFLPENHFLNISWPPYMDTSQEVQERMDLWDQVVG